VNKNDEKPTMQPRQPKSATNHKALSAMAEVLRAAGKRDRDRSATIASVKLEAAAAIAKAQATSKK
jgi:hypothetical protein